MIREFDNVRIKGTDIVGIVVDIYTANGVTMCYVDSKQRGTAGEHGYNADWDLFHCKIDDLERAK